MNPEIVKICSVFVLDEIKEKQFMKTFRHQIQSGLKRKTHSEAEVKCFVTYVQDLPNGRESGKFLALDLGGTNFRVLLIQLTGNHKNFEMTSKIFAIPHSLMVGHGDLLFDYIAGCLSDFVVEHQLQNERLPLGITFSFPLRQEGLTKGILITWTKGFSCDGVVGEDVVEKMRIAIEKRPNVKIEVAAILNDTTGTLMACGFKNPKCRIGVILGTGSNACYVEKTKNCELFNGSPDEKDEVIINTEWGAFGDKGSLDFVATEFDREIDANSINPGKQRVEKMISGMYLGELVRLVLVKLTKLKLLFNGVGSDILFEKLTFFTKFVSEIESTVPGDNANCMDILEEIGIVDPSESDCVIVRYVCSCVSKRAAHLASIGIAGLVLQMENPDIVIGVDGSLYRYHPKFHDLMQSKIKELIPSHYHFDLMLSEDGSGRGAALVAAVASREQHESIRKSMPEEAKSMLEQTASDCYYL